MAGSGFIKKSVGTLTLGEKLKKLRSERRTSLAEVSKYTLIQIKYLEYLEEGDYKKLPADVYVKGFLKNYADFFGVEENVLIRLYEKERGIKKNLEKKPSGKNKSELNPLNISSFTLTPRMVIIAVAALAVFGGFFYLYKEVGSFASKPRLVILSPQANSTVSENKVLLEGVTDRDVKLSINNQPVLVNDEGRFRENLVLQKGENIINVKAVNKFEKVADESLVVKADWQDKVSENSDANASNGPNNDKSVGIEIRVDPGPVWLSVEADGNLVFSGTMLSGATQNFSAQDKISLNSGKGNATFIKFNGKDIGALSANAGPVKNVIFNKDTKY